MNNLYLIIGRTSSGKSTIARMLEKEFDLPQVVSYTTRPQRESEKEAADHYFISKDEVADYKDDMAAYTKIGQYEYFTTYKELDDKKVYVIDPIRYQNLQENVGDRYNLVSIYVNAPQEKRVEKALTRGEPIEVINKRINDENQQFDDFEKSQGWDYIIFNDMDKGSLANVLNQLHSIPEIHKEKSSILNKSWSEIIHNAKRVNPNQTPHTAPSKTHQQIR